MLALARVIRRILPTSPCQTLRAAGTTNLRKCLKRFNIPSIFRYAPSSHLPSINIVRSYSAQVNVDELTVDYEYVKQATAKSSTLIIDVREPHEIVEHGKIPNSVNIPLGNVSPVLGTMPDKDFQEAYKRPKPAEDTEIIFYCMIGKRSGMAQQNAINLGFKNAKNYLGSFTDWASKSQ
ncbi:hypothetical protein PYW08_001775 [Mythimna loreyi]|uniref:Uncharacterized protein n=1 Tax=Mythimna loreyi TaxID=667449 RepID=A0ACC2R7L1_9NEOP|nr:hypothetical protein PYW08_001775 [Mythimna loreyi]